MSWSFWINVAIVFASFFNAWVDHGETLTAFRASSEDVKRRRLLAKLILLWGIPVLSLMALPFTVWDSLASEKKLNVQATVITNTANRLARTEETLKNSNIKPPKERLVELLNSIDPKIIETLKLGQTMFKKEIEIPTYNELKQLSKDAEASKYISVLAPQSGDHMLAVYAGGLEVRTIRFRLDPSLLK